MSIKESDVLSVIATMPEHSFIRRYVEYASNLTDANVAFHVGCGLGTLAATIPEQLRAQFGAVIVPNIFTILYGTSTQSRKTTAIKIARHLLTETREHGARHVGCEPGSAEGLVESIRDVRRQTIYYEELGDLLNKTGAGSYMQKLKTTFNQIADGGPLGRALGGVNTKAKTKAAVTDYLVSLVGGCAPVYLERYAEWEDWTGGFLGRFLYLDAPRERYLALPGDAPDLRQALVAQLIDKLDHQAHGQYLGFEDGARAMWTTFANDLEALTGVVSEEMAAAVARTQQIVLKMAVILAWDYGQAFGGNDWMITADVLRAAIAVGRLHVTSAVAIGRTLASSQDMRDRRKVLSVIPPNDTRGLALGQIITKAKMLKGRVKQLIDTLGEEGLVQHIKNGTGIDLFVQTGSGAAELELENQALYAIGTGRTASVLAQVTNTVASVDDRPDAKVLQLSIVPKPYKFPESAEQYHVPGDSDGATMLPFDPSAPVL